MIVGTSQLDITPEGRVELAGFGRREQPSTGVLDRLACRGLYLQDGPRRLLWLHVDLIGVEASLVAELRQWVGQNLGIDGHCVMLSATHTHSGPGTVHLTGCGEYQPEYVAWLRDRLKEAARAAMTEPEPCRIVAADGQLKLSVDRRGRPSAQTDSRVGALGWRREDGTFKALLINYAMHPVCLDGRRLSADWPGQAAATLSRSLPGEPTALVTVGACGNLDPPGVSVPVEQMHAWGRQVAESVADRLCRAPDAQRQTLSVSGVTPPLPLDVLSPDEIEDYAERSLANQAAHDEFGDSYRRAVEHWRSSMADYVLAGRPGHTEAELFAVDLADVVLLGVNAEVFSRFTEIIRQRTGRKVYTVSCANGLMSYLPTQEAYDEGGYEVEQAMLFYGQFRPRRGSMELLADRACRLIDPP